jgi:hypothetical protein
MGTRTAGVSEALSRFDNLELLGILFALTIVFSGVAWAIFRITDRNARERGLLDKTTNY